MGPSDHCKYNSKWTRLREVHKVSCKIARSGAKLIGQSLGPVLKQVQVDYNRNKFLRNWAKLLASCSLLILANKTCK